MCRPRRATSRASVFSVRQQRHDFACSHDLSPHCRLAATAPRERRLKCKLCDGEPPKALKKIVARCSQNHVATCPRVLRSRRPLAGVLTPCESDSSVHLACVPPFESARFDDLQAPSAPFRFRSITRRWISKIFPQHQFHFDLRRRRLPRSYSQTQFGTSATKGDGNSGGDVQRRDLISPVNLHHHGPRVSISLTDPTWRLAL